MFSIECKSIDELDAVATKLIKEFKSHKIIAFYGEMGVGKTTLIKSICKALGTNDNVSSPTYSLVNEYAIAESASLYHFDFYRINSIEEAIDLGLDDYFYSGSINFIEWPEKINELLPPQYVKVSIDLNADIRNIHVEFVS
jgi:tRNA threonylcarbamoyladenosine biosynthesis protein TsaE